PDTALLMIGDPKQAIYSFRGADLPTYLKARAQAERPHHTLDTNFRSDRALVAAVNGIFRHASQWPGGAFAQDLPFQPVQASREHSLLRRRTGDGQLQSLDALQLDLPEVLEACGKTRAMPILASHCANTIAAWLDEGRAGRLGFLAQAGDRDFKRLLGPGDIAVLVRSRHEAAVLRRALQARDIPSVYGSDRESVYASAEAEQLQIWLEAFAEPAREDRLRLALATPALGRTWTELDHLRVDERTWEDEVEQVRRCHDIWRAQGVLAAVRQWLFQHQVPARLLHPGCADGERSLTNLLHLAELLQSAATSLHGEQALIRHLAECREGGESAGSKDALVRLESDSARVRVVTLHQSKGLEYPLVCMPFSALPAGGAQTAAWRRYHDAAGNLVLDLDSGKDSAASLQSAAEQLQEDLRLFYVGLTRARHLLWLALLPVGQGVKAGGEGDPARALLQQTPWAHVLTGTDEMTAADLLPALQALQTAVPELVLRRWRPDQEPLRRWQVPARPQLARPARVFSGLTGEPWRISSYSGLRQADVLAGDSRDAWPPPPQAAETDEAGADSAGAETFREQVLAGLSALPRGAEIGTFWHGLLEEAAALGFGTDAASLARLDESIAGQCQLRQWQDQVEPLRQALRGWLRHPLSLPAQPGGEVVAPVPLSALTRYQVELEFWMASQGVDVGTLDALVCRHTLSARPRPAMAAARLTGLFKGVSTWLTTSPITWAMARRPISRSDWSRISPVTAMTSSTRSTCWRCTDSCARVCRTMTTTATSVARSTSICAAGMAGAAGFMPSARHGSWWTRWIPCSRVGRVRHEPAIR
ncbi:MAG: 3'-5' exonuclease, partial [Perlucidibaca sp.]